jgi:hypothetical protein
MVRPLALWSTPRSASTAFDRMMRARGDHRVFTEPFSTAYYDGPDRRSDRFDLLDGQGAGPTFPSVWDYVMNAAGREPVFIKELAHHLGPYLEAEALAHFRSSFLIRDPVLAVPSMLAIWPDATDEELSYGAQHTAFDLVVASGAEPVVLDATDLCRDPARLVERWCTAVGVPFVPGALTWEPGLPNGWERWADWSGTAVASRGFIPPDEKEPPTPSAVVAERIELCREHYEALRPYRLT